MILNLVRRDQPTLRQLLGYLAGARGHFVTAGTPEQIAALIEDWFADGAADGFNIMPPLRQPLQDVLILQADADTIYGDCYIEAMGNRARQMGPGVMIDACSEYQSEFAEKYNEYISLCNDVDGEFESLLSDQSQDVIVDDKVCAYWASDYELWGGHKREYTSLGEEIHSETARLYIRAKTYGAIRYLCEEAVAKHSDRRILEDPAYNFATAGFPRERTFKQKWGRLYDGPNDIMEFCKKPNRSKITLALGCRRAHLQGLFQMLTKHVLLAIESADPLESREPDSILDLPNRDAQTARHSPGLLMEDVLAKVDGLVFKRL